MHWLKVREIITCQLVSLLLAWSNFNPTVENKYIHYIVRGGITNPFPNFNGTTVEVWEWIDNLIAHFTRHAGS